MLADDSRHTEDTMHPFERLWLSAVSTAGIKRGAPCPLESEPKRRRIGTHMTGPACAMETELHEKADNAEEPAMTMDQSS